MVKNHNDEPLERIASTQVGSELATEWYWEQDDQLRFTRFEIILQSGLQKVQDSYFGRTRWEHSCPGLPSEEHWARHRAVLEARKPFRNFEYAVISPDGEQVWISASGDPMFDTAQRFIGYRGIAKNVTRQRLAEQAFRNSEARYRGLIELSPDAVLVHRDGILLFINPSGLRLLGAKKTDELIGRSIYDFLERSFEAADRARVAKILQENWVAPPMEARIRCLNGDVVEIEVSGSRVDYQDEPAVQAIYRDVSEIKRAREREVRSRRMEALGRLAGGVAHDFNNILTAMSANLQLAQDEASRAANPSEYLTQIQAATERASELVRQILSFSRAGDENRQPLSLTQCVREVLELLRVSVPPKIELHTDLGDGLATVNAVGGKIHQVLMNLVTNAVQAIGPRAGKVEVQIATAAPRDASALTHLSRDWIRLRVRDNGRGMDDVTRERIFDPFFTTKAPGEGTGLGLSVVYEILRSHDAHVDVQSALGQGTTFDIYFPVASEPPKAIPATKAIQSRRGLHILLLDDDPMVNFAIARLLRTAGHSVTPELDPRMALDIFTERTSDFDLALVDLAMPNMNGIEFARVVLAARPDLPIILASGYFQEGDEEAAKRLGIQHLLRKPYNLATLEAAITKACARTLANAESG